MINPRVDWKEYYMDIAQKAKTKSKDPSTQVGAVIVNSDDEPVMFGFNGMVKGADENKLHWNIRELKYLEVVHAEMNAVLLSRRDVRGCVIFCTHGPCENCLKHVFTAGIREIYYDDPSIIRDRGTMNQIIAITALIDSTGATVENVNTGISYKDELTDTSKMK